MTFVSGFAPTSLAGNFFVTVGVALPDQTKLDMRLDCLAFAIAPTPEIFTASLANLEASLLP